MNEGVRTQFPRPGSKGINKQARMGMVRGRPDPITEAIEADESKRQRELLKQRKFDSWWTKRYVVVLTSDGKNASAFRGSWQDIPTEITEKIESEARRLRHKRPLRLTAQAGNSISYLFYLMQPKELRAMSYLSRHPHWDSHRTMYEVNNEHCTPPLRSLRSRVMFDAKRGRIRLFRPRET
ncbi:MAG: hypothetical protein FJ224_11530 [Lentisphaerae bacterium]|nr:hypothetical protein [Lentisphaerota bacterium]